MARGRMINKKISNSKRVNDMPLQAQLLFTWLIPHLDCNGCFYGSAQMIKSLVVPRKNWSKNQIEKWLVMMENSKKLENKSENSNQNGHSFLRNSKVDECTPLIFRYTLDGEQYLFMPGFVGEQIGLRYDKEKAEFPTFDGKITESSRKKSPLRGREGDGEGEGEGEVESSSSSSSSMKTPTLEKVLDLYAQNIANNTPEIDGYIETAYEVYGGEWISEAIGEAVRQNKKTWAYIEGILRNWQQYGYKDPSSRYASMIKKMS